MDDAERDWVNPVHADQLVTTAVEAGAETLRGPLRYPSETGGWQLGDLDLSEHLCRYRDQELVVIIAATGQAEDDPIVCGICGFVTDEVSDCPRCKLATEKAARRIRRQQEAEQKAMLQEAEEILRDDGDE